MLQILPQFPCSRTHACVHIRRVEDSTHTLATDLLLILADFLPPNCKFNIPLKHNDTNHN